MNFIYLILFNSNQKKMQNDEFLDKDSFYSEGGFQVTNRAKGFLATAAFWGKVVSIAGFVSAAFTALGGLVVMFSFGSLFSQFSQLEQQAGSICSYRRSRTWSYLHGHGFIYLLSFFIFIQFF